MSDLARLDRSLSTPASPSAPVSPILPVQNPSQAVPMNTGMRSTTPTRFLPKASFVNLALMGVIGTGVGLLIRDAVGSQVWLGKIKDGLSTGVKQIGSYFESGSVLGSSTAVSCYIGIGASLASVLNVATFAQGVVQPASTVAGQLKRGLGTCALGAAAGAGWGAFADHMGVASSAGIPAPVLGAVLGLAIGLVQALVLVMNTRKTPV